MSDFLYSSTGATYVIGLLAIGVGVWQYRRTFRLNKKSQVFDDLSKDIQDAQAKVRIIGNTAKDLLNKLADAANSASYEHTGKTAEDDIKEIDRRLAVLDGLAKDHTKYIKLIYGAYEKVLNLIVKVEKSTLVSDKSRVAARYLYYSATEQNQLVGSVNSVLQSFRVVPNLGDRPNISSQTFNAVAELVHLINSQNNDIGTYLEDLETIIHNDLVRRIFGKASVEQIPHKHLTSNGLIDRRTKSSLL